MSPQILVASIQLYYQIMFLTTKVTAGKHIKKGHKPFSFVSKGKYIKRGSIT